MTAFNSFYGIITNINNFNMGNKESLGCYKLITVKKNSENIVNFVVTPYTYVIDHSSLKVGDKVIGFYETNVAVPLIYPPQYKAIVMAKLSPFRNIKVDFFDENLISSDNLLKLIIAPCTQIIIRNNQYFIGNLSNRNLIVLFGPTTKSIPAQTVPYKIIVLCKKNNDTLCK